MFKSSLSPFFSAGHRDEGAALYKARKLSAFFANPNGFSMRVEGNTFHHVSFEDAGGRQWQPLCDCDSFKSQQGCEHLWATLLYLDSEGSKKPSVKQWLKTFKVEAKIKAWFAQAKKTPKTSSARALTKDDTADRAEWKYFVRALAHSSPPDEPRKPNEGYELALVVNAKRSRALDRLVFGVHTRRDATAKFKKSVIAIQELDNFPKDRQLLDFFFDLEGYHSDPSYPRNMLELSHIIFPRDRMDGWLQELAASDRLYVSLADLHKGHPAYIRDRSAAQFRYLTLPHDQDALKLDLLISEGHFSASVAEKEIEILCASYALVDREITRIPQLDERGKQWLRFIEDALTVESSDRQAFLNELAPVLSLGSETDESASEGETDDDSTEPVRIIPSLSFRQSDLDFGEVCYGSLTFRNETQTMDKDKEGSSSVKPGRRNLTLEKSFIQTLKDLPSIQMPQRTQIAFPSRDFERVVSELITLGFAIFLDKREVFPITPRLEFKRKRNWLELSVSMEGLDIDLEEFVRSLKKKSQIVVLSDGSSRILTPKTRKTLERLTSLLQKKDRALGFHASHIPLLEALVSNLPDQESPDFVTDYRKALETTERDEDLKPLPSFLGTLRSYQTEGLNWLSKMTQLGFGVCLADEMGLGKTIQILALLDYRHAENKTNLIVMPRSLVGNWQAELSRFVPRLKVLDFSSGKRAAGDFGAFDIILTTYGVLLRDAELLSQFPWQHVILDEAQAIKNYRSQTAVAAHGLKGEYRIALSGTPLENNASELVSLFRFLNPGLLGASTEKSLLQTPIDPDDLALVSRTIRPLMLRRRKEDVVSELPDKIVNILSCDMDKAQEKIYAEYTKYYRKKIKEQVAKEGFGKAKLLMIEAMLRLRQIACHPSLVKPDGPVSGSAKVDVLMEKLEELEDSPDKVLVFSQFTSFLRIIEAQLVERNIAYEYLDGQTRDRTERVARFQSDPKIKVFLISLKAGGVGLNLTAARYTFIMDPWWNPAVEEQAVARAHRIGQTQQVISYKIVVRNSIEEKILLLQEQKQDLIHAFMDGDVEKNLLKTLTPDDLERLMS